MRGREAESEVERKQEKQGKITQSCVIFCQPKSAKKWVQQRGSQEGESLDAQVPSPTPPCNSNQVISVVTQRSSRSCVTTHNSYVGAGTAHTSNSDKAKHKKAFKKCTRGEQRLLTSFLGCLTMKPNHDQCIHHRVSNLFTTIYEMISVIARGVCYRVSQLPLEELDDHYISSWHVSSYTSSYEIHSRDRKFGQCWVRNNETRRVENIGPLFFSPDLLCPFFLARSDGYMNAVGSFQLHQFKLFLV